MDLVPSIISRVVFSTNVCKESVMKSFHQSNDYKTACVLITFHEND